MKELTRDLTLLEGKCFREGVGNKKELTYDQMENYQAKQRKVLYGGFEIIEHIKGNNASERTK